MFYGFDFFFIPILSFIFSWSLWVIGVQNPIHSILLLILVFFWGTILLFFLQMEYFGFLFLIVYVGAIVVLFLFIIMMLELKLISIGERFLDSIFYKGFFFLLILFQIFFFLNENFLENLFFFWSFHPLFNENILEKLFLFFYWNIYPFFNENFLEKLLENLLFYWNFHSSLKFFSSFWIFDQINGFFFFSYVLQRIDQLRGLGQILFFEYGWSVLLVSILLLFSMIGAVLLTLETNPYAILKSQDLNYQAGHRYKKNYISFLKK